MHPATPHAADPEPVDPTRSIGGPAWRLGQPLTLAQLHRLAAQQHDLLTYAQCRAAGLSWKVIHRRIATGRWVALQPQVYLTRPGRAEPIVGMTAALLGAGDPVALSHDSAAYLHGLRRMPPAHVDLLVPTSRRPQLPGVRLHRTRDFGRRIDELAWPWRTTVEDTVLDCADAASTVLDEAIELAARACAQRATTPAGIARALAARRRHRLRGDLTDVLTEVRDGAESVLEVRFVRDVLRAHGLPLGVGQLGSVAGIHDRAFEAERVLAELDGRLGHAGWQGRRRDSGRDRQAGGAGWFTTRGYWTDVAGTPCRFALELATLLTNRGWRGSLRRCRKADCAVGGPAGHQGRADRVSPWPVAGHGLTQ